MCDYLKWFFEGRAVEWISSIGTLISLYIAFIVFKLERRHKDDDLPKTHIWFNGPLIVSPKEISSLSVVNIGKTSMPIRRLRIIGSNKNVVKFKFIEKSKHINFTAQYNEIMDGLKTFSEVETDIMLHPNVIYEILFGIYADQFIIEAMYYDNTFEFIEIDTSILGGKYILSNNRRK